MEAGQSQFKPTQSPKLNRVDLSQALFRTHQVWPIFPNQSNNTDKTSIAKLWNYVQQAASNTAGLKFSKKIKSSGSGN